MTTTSPFDRAVHCHPPSCRCPNSPCRPLKAQWADKLTFSPSHPLLLSQPSKYLETAHKVSHAPPHTDTLLHLKSEGHTWDGDLVCSSASPHPPAPKMDETNNSVFKLAGHVTDYITICRGARGASVSAPKMGSFTTYNG